MTSRRFLLASSLARLVQKERSAEPVREGYFPEQPERSAFVQVTGEAGLLVLTSHGPDGLIEERAEVPRAHAEALLDVAAGVVEYLRIPLVIGARELQIVRFVDPGPLDLVDLAFAADEDPREFSPLPWFGPEVSADPGYQTRQIALAGLPEAGEVSVSDVALHSLLDALENRLPAARPWPHPLGTAGTDH